MQISGYSTVKTQFLFSSYNLVGEALRTMTELCIHSLKVVEVWALRKIKLA